MAASADLEPSKGLGFGFGFGFGFGLGFWFGLGLGLGSGSNFVWDRVRVTSGIGFGLVWADVQG